MTDKSTKIKIAFFIAELGGGGAEKAALHVLNHLKREAFDVHIILFNRDGQYHDRLSGDVTVHALNITCEGRYNLPDLGHFWKLSRVIRQQKPDMLYCVGRYNNLLGILCKKIFFPKLKVVIREDSDIIEYLSGDKYRRLKLAVFRFLYTHADRLLVPAEGLRKLLADEVYMLHERIYVLPNPLDTGAVAGLSRQGAAEKKSAPGAAKHVMSIGRLIPIKDYPTAFAAIKKARNHVRKYSILGEGPSREELETLAKDMGIADLVEFAGFNPNPYRPLAAADIFLCTSINEGFGMNIIEAMACGVPVVSTNCPHGPKYIITDGTNGLLVPVKNPELTARAIERLCTDAELYGKLAAAGRAKAEEYSIGQTVPRYEEFIRDTLNAG